ncbi:MAG: hypothetical protein NZM29_03180 [Nitrospira sp.]|nr:hypothetical protein [Nitrospira sp.]
MIIKVNSGSVELTPDATTSINGGMPGAMVTLTGTPTSLKATLGNGDDSIVIDGGADFAMPGGVTIDGGHGSNFFFFWTLGKLTLGNLTLRSGDGDDLVQISGGAGKGSSVTGKASFDLGLGPSTIAINEVDFASPGSISIKSSGLGDQGQVTLTKCTVPGGLRVVSQNALVNVILNNSTVGSINMTGARRGQLLITDGTINGNVTFRTGHQASLETDNANITGNVQASVAEQITVQTRGTTTIGGNVALKAGEVEFFVGNAAAHSTTVQGNVSMQGRELLLFVDQADFGARMVDMKAARQSTVFMHALPDGVVNVNQMNVSASQTAANVNMFAMTLETSINGNLSLSARRGYVEAEIMCKDFLVQGSVQVVAGMGSNISLNNTDSGQINNKFTVFGSSGADHVELLHPLTFNGDVTLDLKDGSNEVTIGEVLGPIQLQKNLTVKTGGGWDDVRLIQTKVAGTTSITTGSGTDEIAINYGSDFTGAVSLDTGRGDDFLSIGNMTGAPSSTVFNAGLFAKLGDGNDNLVLGFHPFSGGDINSMANFVVDSVIDGGSGINLLDGLTPTMQPCFFTHLVDLLNWTDPNP